MNQVELLENSKFVFLSRNNIIPKEKVTFAYVMSILAHETMIGEPFGNIVSILNVYPP